MPEGSLTWTEDRVIPNCRPRRDKPTSCWGTCVQVRIGVSFDCQVSMSPKDEFLTYRNDISEGLFKPLTNPLRNINITTYGFETPHYPGKTHETGLSEHFA